LKQDTAEKDLKRFYQLDSDDEDSGEEKTLEELEKELAEDEGNLEDEESQEESGESEDEGALTKGYDPMRGRGEISSSESDDSSDEEEEEEEDDEDEELDEHDAIRVRIKNMAYLPSKTKHEMCKLECSRRR
jgi:hypothetical protein